MKAKCKHCGESFEPTKEDQELYEEGYCDRPDCCSDCFTMTENTDFEYEQHSDADPGL